MDITETVVDRFKKITKIVWLTVKNGKRMIATRKVFNENTEKNTLKTLRILGWKQQKSADGMAWMAEVYRNLSLIHI